MYAVISNEFGSNIYVEAGADNITDQKRDAFTTESYEEAVYTADKFTKMAAYEFKAVAI